jgi:hypothetical protein
MRTIFTSKKSGMLCIAWIYSSRVDGWIVGKALEAQDVVVVVQAA